MTKHPEHTVESVQDNKNRLIIFDDGLSEEAWIRSSEIVEVEQ